MTLEVLATAHQSVLSYYQHHSSNILSYMYIIYSTSFVCRTVFLFYIFYILYNIFYNLPVTSVCREQVPSVYLVNDVVYLVSYCSNDLQPPIIKCLPATLCQLQTFSFSPRVIKLIHGDFIQIHIKCDGTVVDDQYFIL